MNAATETKTETEEMNLYVVLTSGPQWVVEAESASAALAQAQEEEMEPIRAMLADRDAVLVALDTGHTDVDEETLRDWLEADTERLIEAAVEKDAQLFATEHPGGAVEDAGDWDDVAFGDLFEWGHLDFGGNPDAYIEAKELYRERLAERVRALNSGRYVASLCGGEGGTTVIEAGSLDAAWDDAVEWAREGDWGNDDEVIDIYAQLEVRGIDGERSETVLVREAEEPPCADTRDEHDWLVAVSPHEDEPGCEDCRHCGWTRSPWRGGMRYDR